MIYTHLGNSGYLVGAGTHEPHIRTWGTINTKVGVDNAR